MNTRSIRFQLVAWYAGLLTGVMVLLGVGTYFGLQRSLMGTLKDGLLRRARQIAGSLLENTNRVTGQILHQEIEVRYSPGQNARFVRVSRGDGAVLYESSQPKDLSFDPARIARPARPWDRESWRVDRQASGKDVLVARLADHAPDGMEYLVETGAPMESIHVSLRQLVMFLLGALPVVVAVAVAGGYVLVKRALSPVDQITASAARISSQNLNERLPVAQTGDELERLSVALNHMITRLDDAFQYSRRFVADASHELRTPLTVLRGELEAGLQDAHLTAEQRETFGVLLEEVERLAGIVEGLFALSRLDAGEAQREWVRFDLGELTSATADQMGLMAADKKILVSCQNHGGVYVEGDRGRLKQVVVNLLDNAIKYTPDGGTVALKVNAMEGHAVLEVMDNGIGIPTDSVPHVFERFFRVDKARSRELGGAGLGLSIVRSIVTAHQGTIEVTSALGKGSRFRVELPLSQKKPNPNPPSYEQLD